MAQWPVVPGSRVRPDVGTLRRLYVDEGLSVAAIAARLAVAAQTVHNWLVAGGVPRRPSPARFRADIDDGEIVRLSTQEGHTAVEIAEQLACSASVVSVPLLDVVAADLSHGPHVGAVEQSTGKET